MKRGAGNLAEGRVRVAKAQEPALCFADVVGQPWPDLRSGGELPAWVTGAGQAALFMVRLRCLLLVPRGAVSFWCHVTLLEVG